MDINNNNNNDIIIDSFFALTPDKVLQAVEAGGLHCNPVCYPLNSYENRVYEVELEDRTRLVAKFYRPQRWTREQILEEHQFLLDLENDEIPVCAPLLFPGGGTLHTVDGITYCLYQRRGGRAPQELNDGAVARLGMLAARLHNVGAHRKADHRIALNADTYIRNQLAWLEEHNTLPAHVKIRYFTAAERIADITDELMSGVDVQRIHGDFHLGNIIERDEKFWMLDFDDMVVGPPVQDLWLALPGRDEYTMRQREIFIEAYEQIRKFDRRTLHLIEPLRAMRFVNYATWLAKRWNDPVFPVTWPHFGTDSYWEQETEDLEEQLAIIQDELEASRGGVRRGVKDGEDVETDGGEDGSSSSGNGIKGNGNEQVILTNKDFFWDWSD